MCCNNCLTALNEMSIFQDFTQSNDWAATPASGGLAMGNDKPIHVSFALEFFKDIAMKHFSG